MVGGMVSEGRQCCWPPRLCVGIPLVVYPVALLNGGSGGRVLSPCLVLSPVFFIVFPVFGLGLAFCVVLLPLVLSSPPSPFCVCCHSIVGLGLCLCGRVVSLWDSGDGLCWVEERVASTVYC